MKRSIFAGAAALAGLTALMLTTTVHASSVVFSLIDPDPQGVNGTIPTAALSQRTPGGITPVMNDYTGRGYPDITAYYDPDAHVYLPTTPVPRDSRIYFHENHHPRNPSR